MLRMLVGKQESVLCSAAPQVSVCVRLYFQSKYVGPQAGERVVFCIRQHT